VTQNGASVGDDVITWNGDLTGGETVSIRFRAAVRTDSFFLAHPVVNVATYAIGDLTGGSASATFNVLERYKIFLPLTMRNY